MFENVTTNGTIRIVPYEVSLDYFNDKENIDTFVHRFSDRAKRVPGEIDCFYISTPSGAFRPMTIVLRLGDFLFYNGTDEERFLKYWEYHKEEILDKEMYICFYDSSKKFYKQILDMLHEMNIDAYENRIDFYSPQYR